MKFCSTIKIAKLSGNILQLKNKLLRFSHFLLASDCDRNEESEFQPDQRLIRRLGELAENIIESVNDEKETDAA